MLGWRAFDHPSELPLTQDNISIITSIGIVRSYGKVFSHTKSKKLIFSVNEYLLANAYR